MKTLNDFFTTEDDFRLLTIVELTSVKGGDFPPPAETDPFKKKIIK